jgi:hypothetical protein
MTAREKFILGLIAAAAIGAGIYYGVTMSSVLPASSKPVRTDFSALIAKVQVSVKQGELTDREERVLVTATTPWLRNPLRSKPLVWQGVGSSPATPLPKYIGFINTGPQPIAIIDGYDYRPGEAIQGGEFQLTHIYPDHIELLRRGATDPVDVPLEKPQTPGGSR